DAVTSASHACVVVGLADAGCARRRSGGRWPAEEELADVQTHDGVGQAETLPVFEVRVFGRVDNDGVLLPSLHHQKERRKRLPLLRTTTTLAVLICDHVVLGFRPMKCSAIILGAVVFAISGSAAAQQTMRGRVLAAGKPVAGATVTATRVDPESLSA